MGRDRGQDGGAGGALQDLMCDRGAGGGSGWSDCRSIAMGAAGYHPVSSSIMAPLERVDLVDSCFSCARSGVRAEIASQAVARSATNEVLGASGGLLRSEGLDQRAAARSPVALRLCAARGF